MPAKRKVLTASQRNQRAIRTTVKQRASAAKSIERTRQTTIKKRAAAKIETETAIIGQRAQARQAAAIQREQRRGRHRTATRIATKAVVAPTKSSVGETILFVIFIMAGLIVFYGLVSKPAKTNTFLGGLGDWLATVSTTQPLFTNTEGTQ